MTKRIDTSDIPETDEAWFKKAKLMLPKKVDHVRNAKIDGRHTCHWPGCRIIVPPARWGCRYHWFKLPARLRAEIWRCYEIGQEVTKTPSREYVELMHRVQEWISNNG